MRHVPFVCLALCTFAASPMLAPALAQAPSAWTTLSPPGGVDAAKLTFGETVAVYRDGDYMRSYSAITRKWHPHTPSFGTSLFVSDHLAVTPESDRWTAFSAHRGNYETLFVNFATTTWDLTDTMMLVRDGATLHVFSTFTGEWHSHTVRTASSVHTFSAVPEHFAQTGAALGPATARGTLQRHQLQLDTGDVALFTLGPRAATAIPTVFGELWLDPTQVAMELVVQLGGEQRVMFEYAIPDVPALRGSRWFVQPLMLRVGGVPYLADSQAFLVF